MALTSPGGAIKIEEFISTNINFTNLHFHNNATTTANENGGAVFIEEGSGATFTGCNFESNSTDSYGGAIYVDGTSDDNCSLTLDKCTFNSNTATNGSSTNFAGAVGVRHSANIINNCLFHDNNSDYKAGALNLNYGTTTVFNCTFEGNTATSHGGAIRSYGGTHTLTNCIFYGNDGSGDYDDAYEDYNSSITLDYCICPCVSTSGASTTNVVSTGDPLFSDATNNDYTLQVGSPSLDAGTATGAPATDMLGLARPQGAGFDLGCYEAAACSPLTSAGTVTAPGTTAGCDSWDPDNIVHATAASGGTGGTINYLWEKSTDGGSNWVTAGG